MQEELFHLFNYLYDNNKQIIFSSDRAPAAILDIADRLRGRFASGSSGGGGHVGPKGGEKDKSLGDKAYVKVGGKVMVAGRNTTRYCQSPAD